LEAGTDELAKSRVRLSKMVEELQMELGQTRAALLTAETEVQRRAADAAALERQVWDETRRTEGVGFQRHCD
jgi:hypothetical protein